ALNARSAPGGSVAIVTVIVVALCSCCSRGSFGQRRNAGCAMRQTSTNQPLSTRRSMSAIAASRSATARERWMTIQAPTDAASTATIPTAVTVVLMYRLRDRGRDTALERVASPGAETTRVDHFRRPQSLTTRNGPIADDEPESDSA